MFEVYGRVARTGVPERFETYVTALKMWFAVSVYSPRRDHFVAVFDMITERKRAEAALRESRELLRAVVEGTSDVVYVKDLAGRYLLFNGAASRAVGKRPDEVLGKDDTFLFPIDEARVLMQADRAVMAAGEVVTCEESVTTASGEISTFLTTKGPVFDDHGNVSGVFDISRDITERKRAEEERERRREKLMHAQKMESVGRLAGGVAHDFNNMLGVILGHTELALSKVDPAQPIRSHLEEIEGVQFSQKPFSIRDLAIGVRRALERRPGAPSDRSEDHGD
ncbi:MAG: PAS domain S-box protein [Acidobacteria bacterium]|nr:PAS domain S-box protein [Acidobacteriota bacterium]